MARFLRAGLAALIQAYTLLIISPIFSMQGVQEKQGQGARPAIFALSNPVEEAECTAQQAYDWSQGHAIYVSGTAFPGVQRRDGSQFTPGQCNNCLIFPGRSLEMSRCEA